MAVEIPAKFRELLDKPAFAHLATVMPDGRPQVSPVWFDFQAGCVRINSAKGRLKDKNMRRDPRVAVSIQDPGNAYRYIEIRGRIVEITEKGADAHIDALAKKYLGLDTYPNRQPGEVRVIYRMEPLQVGTMG
jgi:PPOX class probable F420-dependent enzyme